MERNYDWFEKDTWTIMSEIFSDSDALPAISANSAEIFVVFWVPEKQKGSPLLCGCKIIVTDTNTRNFSFNLIIFRSLFNQSTIDFCSIRKRDIGRQLGVSHGLPLMPLLNSSIREIKIFLTVRVDGQIHCPSFKHTLCQFRGRNHS